MLVLHSLTDYKIHRPTEFRNTFIDIRHNVLGCTRLCCAFALCKYYTKYLTIFAVCIVFSDEVVLVNVDLIKDNTVFSLKFTSIIIFLFKTGKIVKYIIYFI